MAILGHSQPRPLPFQRSARRHEHYPDVIVPEPRCKTPGQVSRWLRLACYAAAPTVPERALRQFCVEMMRTEPEYAADAAARWFTIERAN